MPSVVRSWPHPRTGPTRSVRRGGVPARAFRSQRLERNGPESPTSPKYTGRPSEEPCCECQPSYRGEAPECRQVERSRGRLPLATIVHGTARRRAALGDGPTLVVNVASKCGLTPQYAGWSSIAEHYADRGFTVLGVPCNQFRARSRARRRRSRSSARRPTASRSRCPRRSTSTATTAIRSTRS